MSTQILGDGKRIECTSEIEEVKFGIHLVDVVVKVTTCHDRTIRILSQDVFDGVCPPHRYYLLKLLLPWFEVAFQQLHLAVTS
jgi:hypothetical protein